MDPELLQFVRAAIKSVWALELLLLLRRDTGAGTWSVERLTRETRSSRLVVAEALRPFKAAGLVAEVAEGTYRYGAPYALDRLIGMLENEYAMRPSIVIKAILSAPNDKIRTFSDAFRLRKE
jgi:hypothetical protein